MTKFLTIKLIEPQSAPLLTEVEEKKPSSWKLIALVGAVVIVLAIVAWNLLPTLAPDLALRRITKKESVPRVAQTPPRTAPPAETPPRTAETIPSDKPPEHSRPVAVVPTGPMPWFGRVSLVLEALKSSQGRVFSVTTGTEGSLLVTGFLPDGTIIQSNGRIFRSEVIQSEKVLNSNGIRGETKFTVALAVLPAGQIPGNIQSVPPYLRGAALREIDSLARATNLSSVKTSALGSETIPEGSRYVVGIQGSGSFSAVQNFVRSVETSGKMIEISRWSVEGINGKALTEDTLRAGFVIRIYDIKTGQTASSAGNSSPVS